MPVNDREAIKRKEERKTKLIVAVARLNENRKN